MAALLRSLSRCSAARLALGWVLVTCTACGSSSGAPAAPSRGGDASTGDASGGDTSPGDAATGAAAPLDGGYPALKFADIGMAVKVSDAFYFTEGPVWDPDAGVLYFTDTNGDPLGPDAGPDAGIAGGAVYRFTPPSTIDVLLQPSGSADGLGLDPQGNLIGAGYISRDVWRRGADGGLQALSPCAQGGGSCFTGMELNTPDDVAARSDGILYVTDPTFGSGAQGYPTLDLPLASAQGVYRLTTDGILHLEDSTTAGPNGVNLSPDEKSLYVSYSVAGTVARFDVAADGSLSNKRTFVSGVTLPDSMCVDAGGNLYVGTFTGLAVYDPTGKHLGTLSVDGLIVTNCAFGGADQKTLFITSRTSATLTGPPPLGGGSLYSIAAMPVPGMPGRN